MKRYPNSKLMPFVLALTLGLLAVAPGQFATMRAAVAAHSSAAQQACTTNPVVVSGLDSGAGSLRQAVIDACAGSTITFGNAVRGTITLTTGRIAINRNLTIAGPGADLLTVRNGGSDGIFGNNGVTATISGLTIAEGRAGGISNSLGGNLTVADCVVRDNQGGGITNASVLAVTNSNILHNSAGTGGGIYNTNSSSRATITNSSITGNLATGTTIPVAGGAGTAVIWGSAISNRNGSVTIINSTIAGNEDQAFADANCYFYPNGGCPPEYGSAVLMLIQDQGNPFPAGELNLINSTVADNIMLLVVDQFPPPVIRARNSIINGLTNKGASTELNSEGYNLLVHPHNTITGDTTGNILGADPRLGPLGYYGGRTMTRALLTGSPAINAGNTATSPALDQRGAPRVGTADIGAFELNNSANGGTFVAQLPDAFTEIAYRHLLVEDTSQNNTVAFTYSLTGGALPTGLSLSTTQFLRVLVSGRTAQTGVFAFSVTGTNGTNSFVTNYSLRVLPSGAPPYPGGCLSNPVVANSSDAGEGTLRQAVIDACAGGTITFGEAARGRIGLTAGPLEISKNLTIAGPGADALTIGNAAGSGPQNRVVYVSAGITAVLSGLTISDGYAGGGGGILNVGNLTVRNAVITNNHTDGLGGGIASGGTLTLVNSSVTGNGEVANTNSISQGGGIHFGGSSLTITDSTVSGNRANQGGGIYVRVNSSATMTNSTIADNSTYNIVTPYGGGGIYLDRSTATLTNCTVSQNSAIATEGGGIYIRDTGTLTLINSTVANNRINGDASSRGAGISSSFGQATVNARNSIIAGNLLASTAFSGQFYGELTSQGYNLIGGRSGMTITGDTTGNIVPAGNAVIDARLSPLGYNGGATQTHALLPGSPAIDQGSAVAGMTADQRGLTRPVDDLAIPNAAGGNGSDIGAFEVQAAACPTITGTLGGGGTVCAGSISNVTVTVSGGTGPYTVTLNNGGGTQTGAGPFFSFAVTPGATTAYLVSGTDSTGCPITNSGSATVNVNSPPTLAAAGGPQAICALGTTAGLGGNTPAVGTGTWSVVSGGTGTFSPNATTPNATFTHTGGAGPVVLRWTITNPPCTASSADVTITVTPGPTTATVGGPQTICSLATTVSLGGNTPVNGTGMWSVVSGGTGTFSPNATTPNATFTHTGGTGPVIVRWTISSGACAPSIADVTITINQSPTTATAGGPQTICAFGTTSGLGSNTPTTGTGMWSVVSGGAGTFNPNAATPNATFTHTGGAGPVVLRWTISNGTCPTSTANVTISINQPPTTATVGPNQNLVLLGTTAGLGGNTPAVGTGMWSVVSSGTGTFNPNATTPNATFTHASGAGPVVLRWTITNPPCSPSTANLTLTLNLSPVVNPLPVTVQAGSSTTTKLLATVSDEQTPVTALTAQVNGAASATVNGVTVSGLTINASGQLQGQVAPACGATTATFTLNVTDNTNATTNATLTVTVTPNPGPTLSYAAPPSVVAGNGLTVNPATGPSDNGNVASLAVQSVTPAFSGTVSVASPNGVVTISNATPVGSFTVVIRATDNCGVFTDAPFTLNVTCPTITVNPASLPGGTVGTAYSQTVSATPAGSYAYSISSGALPTGMTLNASSGAIAGTPSGGGTFSFRLTATQGSCSGSASFTINVACPALTFNQTSLLPGAAGNQYSQTLTITPSSSYIFSLQTGSLPAGVTLSSSGVLSGMPTATGTYNFIIKAQTANECSGTQAYTLAINCPTVAITPASLPAGSTGTSYSQSLSAAPAGGNYSYAVTTGALPAGLSLNPATGVLSGAPTTSGTSSFTITATGFGGCAGSKAYSITVGGGCPTIILPDIATSGSIGSPYNQSVAASPAGSYTYAMTGSLPPGVSFYNAAGLLYGYPSASGTYNFTITSTDGNNCTASKSYSVTIGGAGFARAVFGDFDGDGKTDFSVWRGKQSDWLILKSSDSKLQTAQWGAEYDPYNDVIVPGDYDGDGKFDVAVFRRATGQWLIKGSKGGSVMTEAWGLATDTPVAADYDGDGRTDIAVWRGSNTNWYILRSSDHQTQIVSWGTSNAPYRDVPVPADYDGDGKTDIAVFRQANGHWYIKQSSDGQVIDKYWGLGTDVPVPADYDGDGKADIAVWRGAETNWYIVRSSDDQTENVSWGASWLGDVPVPGDYDGDGKADIAVWRASEGNWYIKLSRDNSVMTKAHGQRGDAPIPARQWR